MASDKEPIKAEYKFFAAAMVGAFIVLLIAVAAIWISTGDDTNKYFATAGLIAIPTAVVGIASGVHIWE